MLDDLTAMLTVLAVVFCLVALRYFKFKSQTSGQLSAQEANTLQQVSQVAERLEQRVAMLERILDSESPAWRANSANFYQQVS